MYKKVALSCIAAYAGYKLLQAYLQGGICKSKVKLNGKVVVITGANTGIGKASAEDLCRRGAKVIILCRSESRALDAIAGIKTRVPDADIHFYQMDLSSLQSIKDCVERLKNDIDKIDILLNNAGIGFLPPNSTADGLELIVGTNHFGHFYLTNLLLPLLREGGKGSTRARVVNVSSEAHTKAKLTWEDTKWTHTPESPLLAYCLSKLLNVLFTVELAERERDNGINTYALHPGVIITEIGRHTAETYGSWAHWFIMIFVRPFTKTIENGAQTSIYCCIDESLENQTGKYYSDCREVMPSKLARDKSSAENLWDLSLKLTKLE